MANAIVYTKPNCPYCNKAKYLLQSQGIAITENVIGDNILREEFVSLFPEQKTVPLIFIDGVKIGGYEQLVEHFGSNPSFLTE